MTTLIRELISEAREQRAFKFRLDGYIKELPDGTTRAILEDARLRAHATETALRHEADALDSYAGLEEFCPDTCGQCHGFDYRSRCVIPSMLP